MKSSSDVVVYIDLVQKAHRMLSTIVIKHFFEGSFCTNYKLYQFISHRIV